MVLRRRPRFKYQPKNRKYKVLIISFLAFLPIWWGTNALNKNLEDFFLLQEISKNTNILNARITQNINQLELSKVRAERIKEDRLANLEIEADSFIVADFRPNKEPQIIIEKNSDQARPIASLTKLMTALIVFDFNETYNSDQIITISKRSVEQEGSSLYGNLRVGDRISVKNLMHKMLIESNNDAAFALADFITEKSFVDLMNQKTKDIGLRNTSFVNSTGLDPDFSGDKNISTAYDLVKLSEYILQNQKEIFEITINQNYKVLRPNGAVHHFIAQNTNKLLPEYSEIIGGKTGWTPLAGECLLVVTEKPDNRGYYISIVLGASDRFVQMRKILNALK